ncbi:MAG: U32 family peptidase [Kineosporiaceae bacterium]
MTSAEQALAAFGVRDPRPGPLPDSPARFPDGGQYRVEIPSVEGPEALRTVLAEARMRGVPVHRVSQGSGITLLPDDEIRDMIQQGRDAGVEICLFTGPRAGWGTGVQATSSSGRVIAGSLRGYDELRHAVLDVVHAADLGVRSVLVSDLGQLAVLARMREAGDLPGDFVLKVSISLPVANPATARVLEDLGATTLNLPVDLPVQDIAAIRAAVSLPLDVYIEGADDFGGPVRYHDLPEIVRVAAPVFVKFTVRNAPNTYPSGAHLAPVVLALAAERVRRASIGLALLARYAPDAVASPVPRG